MMHVEWVRDFCLCFEDVEECQPFGPEHLVYKVKGKMFLLLSLNELPPRINVKTEPDRSIDLRENYPENILPGYHMNKKHWNTLVLNAKLNPTLVQELITHSYTLVRKI